MVAEQSILALDQQLLVNRADMSDDPLDRSSDITALTARMARGEEAAYRVFHDLYCSRLLRYLLVLTRGGEEAARDALQHTLIRVVKHIKTFNSEEAFWSWLTVLARSSVVDEARKRNRYLAFLNRFFQSTELESAVDSDQADSRLLQLLRCNLDILSAEERHLIERKYFGSGSVKEIAGELQCTEKAIESRLVRIRRKLKELILSQLNDEKSG